MPRWFEKILGCDIWDIITGFSPIRTAAKGSAAADPFYFCTNMSAIERENSMVISEGIELKSRNSSCKMQ
jgi:hypothetical protein